MNIRELGSQEFFNEPDQYLALYITTFSSKPYYERFCFEDLVFEAMDLWFNPQNDGLVLACHHKDTHQLMGFFVGFALKAHTDVCQFVSGALDTDVERCFYMAEIMTSNEFRKLGVARNIVFEAIKKVSPRYEKLVLRTNAEPGNEGTMSFWRAVGFTEMPGLRIKATQKRMNGKVSSDTRLFFTRDIKTKGARNETATGKAVIEATPWISRLGA